MEDGFLLRGERVALDTLGEKDLDVNIWWMNDPELRRLLERPDESLTPEKQLKWLEQTRRDDTKRVFRIMYICGNTAEYVGNISVYDIDRKHRETELGIFIGDKRHRGKSIATDAIRLLLKYVWMEIDPAMKIRAKFLKGNEAAKRLYEKLGFRQCNRDDYGFKRDSVERTYMIKEPD